MQRELNKIDEEIEYLTAELSRTSDGDPNLRLLLIHLGKAHDKRYDLLAEPGDIQKNIKYTTIALTLTPDDDPGMPDLLDTLGMAYHNRFQRLGDINDAEKAIELAGLVLATAPQHHPDLPRRLVNLGLSHQDRFERLGELDDIEKTIEYCSRAVAITPNSHTDLPHWLDSLGLAHTYRFKARGELNDLEKAIEYQIRGIALVPRGYPGLAAMLSNLGMSHTYRFQHLGEANDLAKAIEFQSCALALTPENHPELSSLLANMGAFYLYRFYHHLGDIDDLDKAIGYQSRSLNSTPDNHPSISTRLSNLASSHLIRFSSLEELGDLEKSIDYQSRALFLTPAGYPTLPGFFANLGAQHYCRFERLGELGDLEKAIECESRALALITDDHSNFCQWHRNHAIGNVRYYEQSNDPTYLQKSLDSFRMASKSSGEPRGRFNNACWWAMNASKHSSLDCIEAYQTAIDLLPQFIWLGNTTDQRYQDLLHVRTLAVDAASAAISSSKYDLALEWLEHARCVVWSQSLMLRSPLEQLQSSHPTLATRLQTIASQLYSAGSEPRCSQALSVDLMKTERVAQEHRRLAQEYNQLLLEARTLGEFGEFLEPVKANRLMHVASYGPVIVIICHKGGCDALIVSPAQDKVNRLALSNFNQEKAHKASMAVETSLRNMRLGERGVKRLENPEEKYRLESVLLDLWNGIVKPVLQFLGYMESSTGLLPHITWCPTGPVSFLPLHAAGDYAQPRSKVFDYAISSYTPTLTALLASTPSASTNHPNLLAIGLEGTPGHSPLPGTARELASVESHTRDKIGYSQLTNSQATIASALNAMEQHDWVHLACHAHQNFKDSTKSGFFLSDGILDLAAINKRLFKKKGLAFLSACQTATGDERLPDEAVHLAAGMFMAGYSSVIATMWSIVDDDAPLVADKVYGWLMKEGKIGNGEAGKALHAAVADLREKVGEKNFEIIFVLLDHEAYVFLRDCLCTT